MRHFVIELNLIDYQKFYLDRLIESLNLNDEISAKGIWASYNCGFLFGPDEEKHCASKLVSSLMTLKDLPSLKIVTEELFRAGAVMAPTGSLKVHYLEEFFLEKCSERYTRKIIEILVSENRLFYTLLMYPKYSSLLHSDSKYRRLNSKKKLHYYTTLVNEISDEAKCKALEKVIVDVLTDKMVLLKDVDL